MFIKDLDEVLTALHKGNIIRIALDADDPSHSTNESEITTTSTIEQEAHFDKISERFVYNFIENSVLDFSTFYIPSDDNHPFVSAAKQLLNAYREEDEIKNVDTNATLIPVASKQNLDAILTLENLIKIKELSQKEFYVFVLEFFSTYLRKTGDKVLLIFNSYKEVRITPDFKQAIDEMQNLKIIILQEGPIPSDDCILVDLSKSRGLTDYIIKLTTFFDGGFTLAILQTLINDSKVNSSNHNLSVILSDLLKDGVYYETDGIYNFKDSAFKKRIEEKIEVPEIIDLVRLISKKILRNITQFIDPEKLDLKQRKVLIGLWNYLTTDYPSYVSPLEQIELRVRLNFTLGAELIATNADVGQYISVAKDLMELYFQHLEYSKETGAINSTTVLLLAEIYNSHIQVIAKSATDKETISELNIELREKLTKYERYLIKEKWIQILLRYDANYMQLAFSSMNFSDVFTYARNIIGAYNVIEKANQNRFYIMNFDPEFNNMEYRKAGFEIFLKILEIADPVNSSNDREPPKAILNDRDSPKAILIEALLILILTCYFSKESDKAFYYAVCTEWILKAHGEKRYERLINKLYAAMLKQQLELGLLPPNIAGRINYKMLFDSIQKSLADGSSTQESDSQSGLVDMASFIELVCTAGWSKPYVDIPKELNNLSIKSCKNGHSALAALCAGNAFLIQFLLGSLTIQNIDITKPVQTANDLSHFIERLSGVIQDELIIIQYNKPIKFPIYVMMELMKNPKESNELFQRIKATNSLGFVAYLSLLYSIINSKDESEDDSQIKFFADQLFKSYGHLLGYFLGIHALFLLALHYSLQPKETHSKLQEGLIAHTKELINLYNLDKRNSQNYLHMHLLLDAARFIPLIKNQYENIPALVEKIKYAIKIAKQSGLVFETLLGYQMLLTIYQYSPLFMFKCLAVFDEALEFAAKHQMIIIKNSLLSRKKQQLGKYKNLNMILGEDNNGKLIIPPFIKLILNISDVQNIGQWEEIYQTIKAMTQEEFNYFANVPALKLKIVDSNYLNQLKPLLKLTKSMLDLSMNINNMHYMQAEANIQEGLYILNELIPYSFQRILFKLIIDYARKFNPICAAMVYDDYSSKNFILNKEYQDFFKDLPINLELFEQFKESSMTLVLANKINITWADLKIVEFAKFTIHRAIQAGKFAIAEQILNSLITHFNARSDLSEHLIRQLKIITAIVGSKPSLNSVTQTQLTTVASVTIAPTAAMFLTSTNSPVVITNTSTEFDSQLSPVLVRRG